MNSQSNFQKFWWMAGFFVAFLCFTSTLKANESNAEKQLSELRQEWTTIKFKDPAPEKIQAFEKLIEKIEADKTSATNEDPNFKLVYALALSSYAQLKGGLAGLKRAKEAKALLETALGKDGRLGDGLGHAILGALYARVPGWPVGFGDMEKASWHFKTAYAINPKGMDVNYYYGDFLVTQHQYPAAKAHLEEALQGQGITDPVYLTGRKQEIHEALQKIPKG